MTLASDRAIIVAGHAPAHEVDSLGCHRADSKGAQRANCNERTLARSPNRRLKGQEPYKIGAHWQYLPEEGMRNLGVWHWHV